MASFSLMRRIVSLEQYAAIEHALEEKTEDKPEWMLEIIRKLASMLKAIEERPQPRRCPADRRRFPRRDRGDRRPTPI